MTYRPASFKDFAGQAAALAVLSTAVRSAKARGKPLGHVLLTGSPGLGKTTLAASVIPAEMGTTVRTVVCSAIEKVADLTKILSTMRAGEILFLDEIHVLPRLLDEVLYSVAEDSRMDITIGEGAKAQTLSIELPVFTIIAATTRMGLIAEPLRDRMKHLVALELYSDEDMLRVLDWTAAQYHVTVEDLGLARLISACHGTARFAGRLIEACIDTACVDSGSADIPQITLAMVCATLQRLQYSANGLSKAEVAMLRKLSTSKGPVGLQALAAGLDEEAGTLQDVVEPWLLQQGLVERTPTGRTITSKGLKALKATPWKNHS